MVVAFLLQQLSDKPISTDEHLDPESQELSMQIQAELDDAKRIEIAGVLKEKIESKVKKAWGNKQTLIVYTKSAAEGDGKVLLRHAQSILTDNSIPKVDIATMGQIMLYMLQSRAERNIS